MTYQKEGRGISEMLRSFYSYKYSILFMDKLFLPAHAPFGEGTQDKHSADCSLADFKGKTEHKGEGQRSDDKKRVTSDVKLCKINPEFAACCVVSALYRNLDSA